MFGPLYHTDFESADGEQYRLTISKWMYTGLAHALPPRPEPVTVEGGQGGTPDALRRGILPERVTVQLPTKYVHGYLLATSDERTLRAVLYRYESGGPSVVEWTGYAEPGSARYSIEDRGATEITFTPGYGALSRMPLFDSMQEWFDTGRIVFSLRELIGRCLQGLGRVDAGGTRHDPALTLLTLSNLYPWMPSPVAGDPLASVGALAGAFLQQEAASAGNAVWDSRLAVLRAASEAMGLEVFQSGGVLRAYERAALAETFGTGSPATAYDGDLDGGASLPLALWPADEVVDASAYEWLRGSGYREAIAALAAVAVPYDFAPELTNLISDPSFEQYGAGVEDAWTLHHGSLVRLRDGSDGGAVWPIETTNLYILYAEADASTVEAPYAVHAEQEGFAYVPPVSDGALSLRFTGAQMGSGDFGVRLEIGGYHVESSAITASHDTLRGKGAAVRLTTAVLPSGAAATVVLREGHTVLFTSGSDTFTLRLEQDARAGDHVLRGELSQTMPAGATADVPFWVASDGLGLQVPVLTLTSGVNASFEVSHELPLHTPDGTPVYGDVSARLVSPGDGAASGFAYVDEVQMALLLAGQVARRITWQAAAGQAAYGAELSPLRLGDGPERSSRTALHVLSGADAEPTLQGASTGWQRGPYAALDSSSGITHTAMIARTALAQTRRMREAIYASLRLRSGPVRIRPHHVLMLTEEPFYGVTTGPDAAGPRYYWRTHYRWRVRSGTWETVADRLDYDDTGLFDTITQLS